VAGAARHRRDAAAGVNALKKTQKGEIHRDLALLLAW